MDASPRESEPTRTPSDEIDIALHDRSYVKLLVFAGLLGIPLSLVAFAFLAVVQEVEHLVWEVLPEQLGYDQAPAWWPVAALTLAGVLVALAVTRLPGRGGHLPVGGLGGAGPPAELPGALLAAAASLVLGAVIGPEAPLLALGGGLAVLAARWSGDAEHPAAAAILAAAGSAAAISAVFGNPVVAAVILLEAAGLGRRRTMLTVLPALVASGVGGLMFTGLGSWTGLEIGALTIPNLTPESLDLVTVVCTVPLAAVVSAAMWACFRVGHVTAALAVRRTMVATVAAGLVVGCSAAAYALVTDHSPEEVALSGQGTLGPLALHPEQWTSAALVVLLVCKCLAYGVSLGAFRGGAVFPAVFLGAAFGVLASNLIPGLGTVGGLAIGMAAGSAATRMPVTSVVLVTLLLGAPAASQMPVIILAAVTSLVVEELLSNRRPLRSADAPHPES